MLPLQKYADWIFGPSVRSIPSKEKILYLSFDDGPSLESTPEILDVLTAKSVPATFFIIANKARSHPELIKRLVNEGHAIGNHSLDHRYRHFFRGKAKLKQWILESETQLHAISGVKPVGFRSPAGVRTPELHAALTELKIPLIHWNLRFYDTVLRLTPERIDKTLAKAPNGSIILLHDTIAAKNLKPFLLRLGYLIDQARHQGFHFARLSHPDSPTQ